MTRSIDWTAVVDSIRLPTDADTALTPYIEHIKTQILPFTGELRADWLLTDPEASIWKTRTKATRWYNGEWMDTEDVNWAQLLPDGKLLTDPYYSKLLSTCRQVSFLHRQGLTGNVPSIKSWLSFFAFVIRLCNWMVLERSRYHPEQYGFALLDNDGIQNIFRGLARGGWTLLLRRTEFCLDAIHRNVFGNPCPKELLTSTNWPKPLRNQVIKWLETNNKYSLGGNSKKHNGLVSRAWLSSLFNVSSIHLQGTGISLALRQFEPLLQHPSLLLPAEPRTEYPGHRVPLIEGLASEAKGESAIVGTSTNFKLLFTLYRHMPDVLPDPTVFQLKAVTNEAIKLSKPRSHTPFIPLDIGLAYLNEALRWVFCYGDALVEYYLIIHEKSELIHSHDGSELNSSRFDNTLFDATPMPEPLKAGGFQFRNFKTTEIRSYDEWRAAPSLHEALEVWVGAVIVLLGLMKPARESEITTLPFECLLRTEGGGYWLDSDLAKRSAGHLHARTGGRPIPEIVAQAIQQVRKLNRGLVRIHKEPDQHLREMLFYMPITNKSRTGIKMTKRALHSYIDSFCDYVNLPTDHHGRRWYLRIHEMRKWFLLLLFWSGRYDVLDAARWISGHTDVAHIYAYIEREFPAGKIGKLEAECAIDLLAQYDETRVATDGEEVGLAQLYSEVLQHFHVKRLNLVKDRQWHGLVQELFEQNYHLEPITLTTNGDQKRVCIAIRQGNREVD